MALRYSTGAVRDYIPGGCGGPDLPLTIPEAASFRFWYNLAGHSLFTRWENGDVWASDFRDASGGDLEPSGGSDVPDIYFYSGHGGCQNPPAATSPDFIIVCGNFGTPNTVTIGTQSRWGNGAGNLKFAFIDASCPMDLVSIQNSWFPSVPRPPRGDRQLRDEHLGHPRQRRPRLAVRRADRRREPVLLPDDERRRRLDGDRDDRRPEGLLRGRDRGRQRPQ